jgi:SET family sugar efflux transporter-like MFS transporter
MSSSPFKPLWSSPVLGIFTANVFLAGVGVAAIVPFRAIVGVEALGLSNTVFAGVMALNAIVGAAAGVLLGWLSDKVGDRRWLVLLCGGIGALGFALVWLVRTPLGFMLAFCLFLPFRNALFSQLFSYSRAYLDRELPGQAEFALSFLRTLFTLAWIVTPPLAGWLAAEYSAFTAFGFAAITDVGFLLLFGLLWTRPSTRVGVESRPGEARASGPTTPARIPPAYQVGVAGVTLGLIALQLNMMVLPLVIVKDLGGTLEQVGLNASIAAAIEFPLMLGWGYLASRMRKETILAISCAALGLYLGLLSVAQSVLQVFLLQALAALGISALLSINISYLQEAIKGRLGLSTSLVDVTRVLSALVASGVFALSSEAHYAPIMALAAGAAVGGAALMLLAGRLNKRGELQG